MKVILQTGDPSQDGHNHFDTIILETDGTVEDIEFTYKKINEELGFDIDILNNYHTNYLEFEYVKELRKIPDVKNKLSEIIKDGSHISDEKIKLAEEILLNSDGTKDIDVYCREFLRCDVKEYVELFCIIMNHFNKNLNLRVVEFPVLPFSIGYGLWEYEM